VPSIARTLTMNRLAHKLIVASFAASSLALVGCSSDDDNGNNNSGPVDMTITGQLSSLGLNQLAVLVAAADLDDDLQGTGPFTLFAPTDAAIGALDPATVTFLTDPANQAALVDLLSYHVVAGQELDSTAVAGLSSVTTLEGSDAIIEGVDGELLVNNAVIAMPDNSASNGVIHIIDTVLREPTADLTTSLADDGYATLVDLIDDAGLTNTANTGNFTILAPTDAAFAALPPPNDLAFYQNPANVAELTTLLQNHLIAGATNTAETALAAGDVASVGGPLLFFTDDGVDDGMSPPTVNGIELASVNRPTMGGLIHGIGSVNVAPGDIPTVATNDGNFTALVQELTDAMLVDDLQMTGPFTVFAPSDTAITNWVAANGNTDLFSNAANQGSATQVLTYHVVAGDALQASEVVGLTSVTTLEGSDLFISVDPMTSVVSLANMNGGTALATIVATNVFADNGVIHVIDAVLTPDGFVIP